MKGAVAPCLWSEGGGKTLCPGWDTHTHTPARARICTYLDGGKLAPSVESPGMTN